MASHSSIRTGQKTRPTGRTHVPATRSPADRSRREASRGKAPARRWSREVTLRSNALDLEPGVFTRDPRGIALSLKRSAERSARRKSSPFRSAMSMLIFYENRAGRSLPASRKRALQRAKDELRKLYGRAPKRASS